MIPIPLLSYKEVINGLQRHGFVVVRQKGSHIRLHKHTLERTYKITVPAHNPIKKITLKTILEQAEISIEEFIKVV